MKRLVFPITEKEAKKTGKTYSSATNRGAVFPSRLRELREKAGLSQAALANVLHVSKSTVGLHETGDTLPDAKTLYDLAEIYGVSADYILGRTDFSDTTLRAGTLEDYGFSQAAVKTIADLSTSKFLESVGAQSEKDNFERERICTGAAFDMLVRLLEDARFVGFLHGAAIYAEMHISDDSRIEAKTQIGKYGYTYKTTGAVIREITMQEALSPLIALLKDIEVNRAEHEKKEAGDDAEDNE